MKLGSVDTTIYCEGTMGERSRGVAGSWFDRVLLSAIVVMLAVGFVALYRANLVLPRPTEPSPLPVAVGKPLEQLRSVGMANDTAIFKMQGGPHLVYVFSTTCHFCESQRIQMARVLESLPAGAVVTASEEPVGTIAGYWTGTGAKLPAPVSVPAGTFVPYGINGVPAMLFVNADGRVRAAYVGTARGWDRSRFQKELNTYSVALGSQR